MTASDNATLWEAQTELSAAIAKAGMHFEGRPYPVSLRPLAITERQSKGIADVAEQIVAILDWAAELNCRDASVQRLFPAYVNLMK
jgi:diaminobutyrate-2-oxoglutarate transaminase